MTAAQERSAIRILHLVLSIPILGYLYGPVSSIPQAAWFTRWLAMPLVVVSGLWLWLKPRLMKRLQRQRGFRAPVLQRSEQLNSEAAIDVRTHRMRRESRNDATSSCEPGG